MLSSGLGVEVVELHPAFSHAQAAVSVAKNAGKCSAVNAVPVSMPEWQVSIRRELGQNVEERVKDQMETMSKHAIPKITRLLARIEKKRAKGKQRIRALEQKIKQDPALELVKKAKASSSAIPKLLSKLSRQKDEQKKAQQQLTTAITNGNKLEQAYFFAVSADLKKSSTKPASLSSQRNSMFESMNKVTSLQQLTGKLAVKLQSTESALSRERETVNKAHAHMWKPAYYNRWIKRSKKRVSKLLTHTKRLKSRKEKLEKQLKAGSKALTGIKKRATAFADHGKLANMMYQRVLANVDREVAKGIRLSDRPWPIPKMAKCEPAKMRQVLCDYLQSKQNKQGHFRGLPDSLLSQVSYELPRQMAAYYSNGATNAVKKISFVTIQAVFDNVFKADDTQKSLKKLAVHLYRDCLSS